MKNIEVKNYRTLKGNTLNITGADFIVKELIPQAEVSALHANVVEVQPGQTSYSYHWHEKNEEVFFYPFRASHRNYARQRNSSFPGRCHHLSCRAKRRPLHTQRV